MLPPTEPNGDRYMPQCKDIWLLSLPEEHKVLPQVWQVVGMAAVFAMEEGRKALWRLHSQQPLQPLSSTFSACLVARTSLWSALEDIILYHAAPPNWSFLDPTHPFFGGTPLQVVHPLALLLPRDL